MITQKGYFLKLKEKLIKSGIDVSLWGKGPSRTLEALYNEIVNGEAILFDSGGGKLLRKVTITGVDLFYTTQNGKLLKLKQEKQVFKDGRIKFRHSKLSVSEKMKPNETPLEATLRGITEELGISGPFYLSRTSSSIETLYSKSYPGLKSQYLCHHFKGYVPPEQYDPCGYIEEQDDKTTFFVWDSADNVIK